LLAPVSCYCLVSVRKLFALTLIVVGLGMVVFFGMPHTGSDPVAIEQHQKAEVSKIRQGVALHKCPGALIRVPSWGHYVMPIENGVSEKVLNSGVVGHFPHTGPVGRGNYALTAHVVTHGEPFARLPELTPGDRVVIEKCGTQYTFKVTNKFNVYYTNVSVLNNRHETLTLITCASRFVHTDYRTVVRARLT